MSRALRALLVVGALFVAHPAALRAQDAPAPDTAPATTASPAPVPPELASPRATMRTFLVGMERAANGDRAGLAQAAACLDLSGVNETLRSTKGPELALQLKQVIDRVRYVTYDEVPDAATGDPYVFHRDAQGRGDIVIARQPDGRWLFTAETVAALPALVRALEHAAAVEGATEVPFHLAPSLWLRERMPAGLRATGFLLEHWQWLGLLALALIGIVADRLLVALIVVVARVWLSRKGVTIDQAVVARGARPLGLLAMALVWRLGDVLLALPLQAHNVLLVAVNFVVAVSGVWGAYRVVDVVAEAMAQRAARTDTRFDDLLVPLLRKTARCSSRPWASSSWPRPWSCRSPACSRASASAAWPSRSPRRTRSRTCSARSRSSWTGRSRWATGS